jgi:hypothetical protein
MVDRSGIETIIKSEYFTNDEKVEILCQKVRQGLLVQKELIRQVNREKQLNKQQEEETKKMAQARDMYGNEIQAGDYINYPVRRGSATYMRTAKVLEVRTRKNHLDKDECVLSVAVALAPRWSEWKGHGTPDTRIKKTTVSCPFRATIVPKPYIQNDPRYATLTSA